MRARLSLISMIEVTPCESLALLDCASWLIVSPYPCQVESLKI
jgi:hypothetical protein